MDFDCISNIIIYCDYLTTLSILRTCKWLNIKEEKLWKLKYGRDYNDEFYFDFWSFRDNYIAKIIQYFVLGIYFDSFAGDNGYVSEYIYEYHPILLNILNMSKHACGGSCSNFIMLKFEISERFILVGDYGGNEATILGQYETKEDAIEHIEDHQCYFHHAALDYDKYHYQNFAYAIIDLKLTKPYFLRVKSSEIYSNSSTNIATFYYGQTNSPIDFS